jgi:hypothetical protein
MLHEVCRCPYCRTASGLDDQAHTIVHAGGGPCPHCAFVSAGIDAWHGKRLAQTHSCFLLWVRGEGLRRIRWPGPPDHLDQYVQMVATNNVPGHTPAGVEYRITGGTATEREEARLGSGHFALTDAVGRTLEATLDGWGVYSPDPGRAVAAFRSKVEEGGPPR